MVSGLATSASTQLQGYQGRLVQPQGFLEHPPRRSRLARLQCNDAAQAGGAFPTSITSIRSLQVSARSTRSFRETAPSMGYNTDVPGFLEPLRPLLDQTHYFRMARVLGTGGAARAIVKGLVSEKLVIVLAGRDPAKARALLDELDPGGEHHAASIAHFADPTDFAFDDRGSASIWSSTPLRWG